MKRLVIILFLISVCYGAPFILLDTTYADVYTSHQLPVTDSTLDIGSTSYFWRYIYGDTLTDGTFIVTNGDITADSIRVKSPWVDVTHPDFGAVGDGVENDTTAIQAALDAVRTAGGGVVFFPKGTYLTDQLSVYSNTTLTGTGNDSILILNDNGGAQNLLLIGNAESYVLIEKLKFDGNNQDYYWHCLIKAYGADYTTVQNCHVTNMGLNSHGIWFARAAINCMAINNYVDNCESGITLASNGTLIRGNTVVNCAIVGINVESSSIIGGNIGVIVSNNYIDGNATTNFGMRFGGGFYAGNHLQIIDNTIFDCVITGISARSSDDWDYEYITIRGNICNGNGAYGISVSCDPSYKFLYSIIEGNICSENIKDGIYLYRLDQCIINNNICRENGVGGTYSGIRLLSTTKSLIQNNSCQDNTNYGIKEDVGSDNNLISGNYLLGNTTGQLAKTGANTIVRHNIGYAIDPPANATSTGTEGTITYDSDYIYVAVATDTWKRTALSTWAVVTENVIFAGENVIFAAEQVVYPL